MLRGPRTITDDAGLRVKEVEGKEDLAYVALDNIRREAAVGMLAAEATECLTHGLEDLADVVLAPADLAVLGARRQHEAVHQAADEGDARVARLGRPLRSRYDGF